MFYKDKTYSLTDFLVDIMPEDFPATIPAIRAIMNTSIFKFVFPDLTSKYGENKPIDFQCAFSKDFLEQGHLENSKLSQVYFREGDQIELDINFGCSIYVYDQGYE